MMKTLTITDQNFEGYVELFNEKEKLSHKSRIKNMKIYSGLCVLATSIGIAVGACSNYELGAVTSLFLGGWGVFIKQKVDELGDQNSKIDEDTVNYIKEKYPNIDLDVNESLLYLALEKEGMIVESKRKILYAKKENFQRKDKKVFCKEEKN